MAALTDYSKWNTIQDANDSDGDDGATIDDVHATLRARSVVEASAPERRRAPSKGGGGTKRAPSGVGRGPAAAATWIFCGRTNLWTDEDRRRVETRSTGTDDQEEALACGVASKGLRRGCHVDHPRARTGSRRERTKIDDGSR